MDSFFEEWRRQWYAGEVGRDIPPVRIARMRRGKWVFIPPEWRGKVTSRQTIRKRKLREPRDLSVSERRLPTLDDELRMLYDAEHA